VSKESLSRRRFLLLSAAFATPLVAAGSLPALLSHVSAWSQTPSERLVDLFRRKESARVIGRTYLQACPSEARASCLVDEIASGLEGGAGALRTGNAELKRRLALRIRNDFAEDEIVCLEGWVLSRTEARLCALATLV
jgi:hypothetical protein